MDRTITIAQPKDADIVYEITQTTVRTVYPRYYPAGAVEFFSAHHSMDRIVSDIENGFVYLLFVDGSPVGTVTISDSTVIAVGLESNDQNQALDKYNQTAEFEV